MQCRPFFCFVRMAGQVFSSLFLPEVDLHRYPGEIPVVADVVFEEAAVRFLDVLRQVDEERELRRRRRQLGYIFDLDVFALGRGRRVIFDQRQQEIVERRGRDAAFARLVDPDGRLEYVENALFAQNRGEDDRNVVERCEFLLQRKSTRVQGL